MSRPPKQSVSREKDDLGKLRYIISRVSENDRLPIEVRRRNVARLLDACRDLEDHGYGAIVVVGAM